MSSLSQAEKQEIHDDLVNRVATWVTGPRVEVVIGIAKRVLGEPESDPPPSDPPADEVDTGRRK